MADVAFIINILGDLAFPMARRYLEGRISGFIVERRVHRAIQEAIDRVAEELGAYLDLRFRDSPPGA